jgi:hypothetical protein
MGKGKRRMKMRKRKRRKMMRNTTGTTPLQL